MSKNNRRGKRLKWWVIPALIILITIFVVIFFYMVRFLNNKIDSIVYTDLTTNSVTSKEEQKNNQNDGNSSNSDFNIFTSDSSSQNNNVFENGSSKPIKGYVNTFGGYTSIFAANGGNVTQSGSNFEQRGLNVEVNIEDDDDKIIEAFVNGDIQFFAMTVNKMPIVSKQLKDRGIETIMPYFLDTSTGGDGIVADNNVNTITDLKNVKVGMAKNSVSTAIPVWFLNESGLSEDDVQQIVNNFVLFDSTGEAVDAFITGQVEAVSTWDMTGALAKQNSHLLFSTASAEYLVIDGIVFNKEFVENNQAEVIAMVDGIISTVNDINNNVDIEYYYDAIRQSVPDFSDYSDDDITEEISYAKFLGYNGNIEALDIANSLYKDFCKVWKQLGFQTDDESGLITDSYITSLDSKWHEKEYKSDISLISAEKYVDKDALISQYAKILFNGDSAEFKTGYEKEDREMIDQFIKVAKILNKTVIQISGHVNLGSGSSIWDEQTQSYKLANGFTSSEFAYKLSYMRAETVKEYMISQGIPEERIIIEGLGGDYPIDTNDTVEGQANNRSCEISFYQMGY